VGKDKIPYHFALINEETFSLAGLYDVWRDAEGKEIRSFTIITCGANDIMQPIHNRMPVILKRSDEHRWLDTTLHDPSVLLTMLTPFSAHLMTRERLSPLVNKVANDGPEILKPVPEPEPENPPVNFSAS
jgi:putative SOS response-associated peptidase YedK